VVAPPDDLVGGAGTDDEVVLAGTLLRVVSGRFAVKDSLKASFDRRERSGPNVRSE